MKEENLSPEERENQIFRSQIKAHSEQLETSSIPMSLRFSSFNRSKDDVLMDHEHRLLVLEEKLLHKKKGNKLTTPQKVLLLHELGLLDTLLQVVLTGNKQRKLLSILLDTNETNLKGYMDCTTDYMRSKANLKKISDVLDYLGMDELSEKIDQEMDKKEF